jgi:hypothetical protein
MLCGMLRCKGVRLVMYRGPNTSPIRDVLLSFHKPGPCRHQCVVPSFLFASNVCAAGCVSMAYLFDICMSGFSHVSKSETKRLLLIIGFCTERSEEDLHKSRF